MAKKTQNENENVEIETVTYAGGMGIGVSDYQPTPGTTMLPKVTQLKERGQFIDGIIEGAGPEVEVHDPVTGEAKALGTHVFNCGGAKFALLTSYQLDRELPKLVGRRVKVTYGGQHDTKRGTRVRDFLIEVYD